jgi:hypothetical protein
VTIRPSFHISTYYQFLVKYIGTKMFTNKTTQHQKSIEKRISGGYVTKEYTPTSNH